MCLLCDQARARQFQAISRSDGLALYGFSIAPTDLIDERFVAATRQATATDDVLDYYLHTTGGAVSEQRRSSRPRRAVVSNASDSFDPN